MLTKSELCKIKGLIEESNSIVVIPHVNPDGDGIGASTALCKLFVAMGKNSIVAIPNSPPAHLNWLAEGITVLSYDKEDESKLLEESILSADLLVVTDFNEVSRAGKLRPLIEAFNKNTIAIDHHPASDTQWTESLIESGECATCVVVYNLLVNIGLGDKLGVSVAESLYAGLLTDTGKFSHGINNSMPYKVAGALIECGVDHQRVIENLFHQEKLSSLKLRGFCLSEKLVVLENISVAYICLTHEELSRFEFEPGDLEGIVNYPLSIKGVEMSALFTEQQEGHTKISLRSKGDFAVNELASMLYGGGGHKNAAGAKQYQTPEKVLSRLLRELPNYEVQIGVERQNLK
ncbi:MAG: DHH family phosphoesterase [Bacteroidales bacterium]